jgi:hypothetical protein
MLESNNDGDSGFLRNTRTYLPNYKAVIIPKKAGIHETRSDIRGDSENPIARNCQGCGAFVYLTQYNNSEETEFVC